MFMIVGLQGFSQRMDTATVKPTSIAPARELKSYVWDKFPNHYHILAFNYGNIFPISPGQATQAYINYTSVPVSTGSQKNETFTGTARNGFANRMWSMGGDFESIWKEKNDIVLGIGGFRNVGGDGGFYFHGGYRYVLNMGSISLKPGLDYYAFRGSNHVGDIDNKQQVLYFDGFTSGSEFTITRTHTYMDDNGNEYQETTYHTYSTDRVEVKYRRKAKALQPLLEASGHWRRLSVSMELGYMIQIHQKSTLVFDQVNDYFREREELNTIRMRRNGVLTGPRVSLMIGFLL
ncbi:hypothetical protein [Chitinophaga sancti]|nr:hypothetical protein [Chitinophaga sancti]WQD62620.1 hypothetical protein U0033_32515 [Chitinophaga sancti]WQG91810.1 hypothetical protein SR876_09870 [Chitinophaga sancti]